MSADRVLRVIHYAHHGAFVGIDWLPRMDRCASDACREAAERLCGQMAGGVHPYTCELCKPSPEWWTRAAYAEHMAAEHGTVTVAR